MINRPPSLDLKAAFENRKVFLTGHTGFKGGWLLTWLNALGANVTGFSLPAPSQPSLFEAAQLESQCQHVLGDLREAAAVGKALTAASPDVVFHLAAQPLVRLSYEAPLETLDTNVMGTAHVLEAIRRRGKPCAVVIITTDKCYENQEWTYGYREVDPVGGHDIYSVSKAAAELVVAGYRRSFFPPASIGDHGVAVATARAGNVIGGGDWAASRLVPDCVAALAAGREIVLRNPHAIRPWQHVLEPLAGYLELGARLLSAPSEAAGFVGSWNLGPDPLETHTVEEVVGDLVEAWGEGSWRVETSSDAPHEASRLALSIEKACQSLEWRPRWSLGEALRYTVAWYRDFYAKTDPARLRERMLSQIEAYGVASRGSQRRPQAC